MANNSIFHEVSEKEKTDIKNQAKKIMQDFGAKLEKVKTKESHFENNSGLREEGEPWKADSEFRDLLFLNAPFVEENFLVAEKGSWKK